MPRHYITDTRQKKNFIAASKAFQDDYHAQVAIHCGMARLGPKKQRLTRAEWKAQKEHAMKVAAAESALLDVAAQREVNAAKQERANADTAAVLAEEKRKARDAITQAHEAMQEAKRLQAEANAKYAAAEAVLEKFDSPTYHPSRRRPKGRGGHSSGRVRAMSAYQSNVKVEPPCVARSARTPGSIVTSSTTKDSKESAPAPCSAWGASTKTRARRLRRLFMPSATSNRQVATTRQRWAAKRSEQRGGAGGKTPASWSRAQRLAADILKRIIKA